MRDIKRAADPSARPEALGAADKIYCIMITGGSSGSDRAETGSCPVRS